MNIVVLLKQVPDLVEELVVEAGGTALDQSELRFVLNEFDEHALEQALLLKEEHGGQVKVLALDVGEVEDTLFTALAKGATSAAKITGPFEWWVDNHTAARIFQKVLEGMPYDLILTGVQAIGDLDGQIGAMVASTLGLPYVGVLSGLRVDDGGQVARVRKDYPGSVVSEIGVRLPAVLGIQSAAQPPRYVPVARVRQAMKTARIEAIPAPDVGAGGGPPGLRVRRMFKPDVAERAEILSGSMDGIVGRVVGILSERGLVR